MKLSVIIPTYRRPRELRRALASLREQLCTDYEVLVVDNDAEGGCATVVAEFASNEDTQVSYLVEPKLGLHLARHAGVHAAVGELMVFTDDDATFDPGWLSAYRDAFLAHPEMMAAGGPVRPSWESPPPDWLLRLIDEYMADAGMFPPLSLMEPFAEPRVGPGYFFFGVNMAVRREMLFDVGGFHPEAIGDRWVGDGESGLNRKLWEREAAIGYQPAALVYHHIPVSRATLGYLCRRQENEGAADVYARCHGGIPGRASLTLHSLRSALLSLAFRGAAILRRHASGSRSVRMRLQAAKTGSEARYLARLVYDEELRRLVLKNDWLRNQCESASYPS